MKITNIRIFHRLQMSNTVSNMVTPLGAPFLRTTHLSFAVWFFVNVHFL